MKKKISLSAVFALSISAIVYAQKIDVTVRFPKGSDVMLASCAEELKTWTISNFHYRNDIVELRGHTDSDADTDFNQKLSERRNEAVKSVLEQNGFKQIRFVAYGENSPVCQSQNEECMQKNRRVEVVLYNEFSEQFLLKQDLPLPQTTFINHEKGDIIRGEKGTEIYIPSKSFLRPDGSAPQGDVRIELNEFYDIKDCLKSKLTTTSNGQLIESGGMVFLEAFDETGKLDLTSDAALKIVFKTQESGLEEGMQVFNGKVENGIMNWVPSKKPEMAKPIKAPSSATASSIEDLPLSLFGIQNVEVISGGRESLILFGLISWDDMTAEEKARYEGDQKKYAEALEKQKEFQKQQWHKTKFNRGELSWEELTTEEQTSFKNDSARYKREMKRKADEYKQLLKARQDSLIAVQKAWQAEQAKYYATSLKEFQNKTRDGQMIFTLRGALSVRQLGWINCDRFLQSTSRIDQIVSCEMTPDTEVQLIFKDIAGIMQGYSRTDGRVVFNNIPAGSNAFLLYKGKQDADGNFEFDLQEIKTSTKTVVVDAKKTSIEEMNALLSKMDRAL
ncbi:MAG: OmpA family protein [Flavobacteriales bacterium]